MSAQRNAGAANLRSLFLLLCALLPQAWLEQSMARHMLVQLPLIALAGFVWARNRPALARLAWLDVQGLTGLLTALMVSACWMVPRALELAVTSGSVDAAKFASVFAAGALLPGAFQRANRIVQLFFLGNFCAMTAIVGMLYQEQPRQLCNVYTVDDQIIAGIGLVGVACLAGLLWCMRHYAAFVDTGGGADAAPMPSSRAGAVPVTPVTAVVPVTPVIHAVADYPLARAIPTTRKPT